MFCDRKIEIFRARLIASLRSNFQGFVGLLNIFVPFLVPIDEKIYKTKLEIEELNRKLDIASKLPLWPLFFWGGFSRWNFESIIKNLFLPQRNSDANSFFLCIHWGCCTYQTTVTHTTNHIQQPGSLKHTEDSEDIWEQVSVRIKWEIGNEKFSTSLQIFECS